MDDTTSGDSLIAAVARIRPRPTARLAAPGGALRHSRVFHPSLPVTIANIWHYRA
jgi:hypothetical protein